jgi:hypothetical protein
MIIFGHPIHRKHDKKVLKIVAGVIILIILAIVY